MPTDRSADGGLAEPRGRVKRLLWDGHAVGGTACSLLLFIMFYAGAFTLYRGELVAWTDPALRGPPEGPALSGPQALLDRRPPDPGTDVMVVHPFGDRPYFFLRYESGGEEVERRVGVAPGTERPRHGRSALPDLVHDLHYFKQLGTSGRTLSGVVSVVFVFLLVSGLVLHLDKLPRLLHAFRAGRGLRLAVTDAHTTLGVLGLPFTLMYGITGAFFGLLILILAPTVLLVFGGDQDALDARITGVTLPKVEASGVPAPPPDLAAITRDVSARWGDDTIVFRTDVLAWGDASSKILAQGRRRPITSSGALVMDTGTGEVEAETRPEDAQLLAATVAVMSNLHFARLGTWLFDPLFFILALFTSAVILTGNILWLLGRSGPDLSGPRGVDRLLGRASIGISLGLVFVIPAALVLSRVLPLDGAGLRVAETSFFFLGWLIAALAAFFVRAPLLFAARLLTASAVLSLVAVLVDLTLTPTFDRATLSVNLGLAASAVSLLALRRRAFSGEAMPPLQRKVFISS